jgi:hypothetical protein
MPDVQEVFRAATHDLSPEPGLVERVMRRGDRKRRNQRIGAGAIGGVIGLVLVAVVARHAFTDPTPADEPSPSPVARVGFIGVPPEGAEPSTPVTGELVLEFHHSGRGSTSGYDTDLYVYADGRIVWQRSGAPTGVPEGASERSTGYLEQTLTPEGVEALRRVVLDSGLVSGHTRLRVRCGDDPDVCSGRVSVRGEGRNASLAWYGSGARPATEAELDTIRGLVERLLDPRAWLSDTAWEDRRIRAFVASRYLVSLPIYGNLTPDLSRLPPPADEILLEEVEQCVTTDEARSIAEGFQATGESPSAAGPGVYFGTDVYVDPHRADVMYVEPILPHGSCRWAS